MCNSVELVKSFSYFGCRIVAEGNRLRSSRGLPHDDDDDGARPNVYTRCVHVYS